MVRVRSWVRFPVSAFLEMINRILHNFYTPIYIEPGTYSCKIGYKIKDQFHFAEIKYPKDQEFITNGVISDYENAKEFFSREIAKLAINSPIKSMVEYSGYVTVHSKITDVELSALEDSLKENKFRIVKFYNESLTGIDFENIYSTNLSVNFGYSTTEIVFMNNGRIVKNSSIDFGTQNTIKDVSKYIEQKYNSKVSEVSITKITETLDLKSKKTIDLLVKDVLKNKSIKLKIQANELYPIVKKTFDELSKIISSFMEDISIDDLEKIESEGIYISGNTFQNSNYLSYIFGLIGLNLNYLNPEKQIENFIEISKLVELEFKKDIL